MKNSFFFLLFNFLLSFFISILKVYSCENPGESLLEKNPNGPIGTFRVIQPSFYSDGDGLVFFEKSGLFVFDTNTGKENFLFSIDGGEGYLGCQKGKEILFSKREKNRSELWFKKQGEEPQIKKIEDSVESFSFFPEDCTKVLITNENGEVIIFDFTRGIKKILYRTKPENIEFVISRVCGEKILIQDFPNLYFFNKKFFEEKKIPFPSYSFECGPGDSILGIFENCEGIFFYDNGVKKEKSFSDFIINVATWKREKVLLLQNDGTLLLFKFFDNSLKKIFQNEKLKWVVFLGENKIGFFIQKEKIQNEFLFDLFVFNLN